MSGTATIAGGSSGADAVPARVAAASGPLYPLFARKWFLDELYDVQVTRAVVALFGAGWAFDLHLIDGLVNRLGDTFQVAGRGLRRLQTGVVGNYALTIVVGLLFVGATLVWLRLRQ